MFVSLRSGLFVTDVFWWHVMSLATTSRSDAPTIYAWNGQIYRGSIALPPLEDGRINCGWIWGNARRHNPITGLGETREIRRRPEILSLNIRLLKPRNAREGYSVPFRDDDPLSHTHVNWYFSIEITSIVQHWLSFAQSYITPLRLK